MEKSNEIVNQKQRQPEANKQPIKRCPPAGNPKQLSSILKKSREVPQYPAWKPAGSGTSVKKEQSFEKKIIPKKKIPAPEVSAQQ